MYYKLESSQADRINFDEMVERSLEAALDALDKETAMYYATQDPETFIGVQWDADSVAYNADSVEYAEDMGMIYVEDMPEAEARYYVVGADVLKSFAENQK